GVTRLLLAAADAVGKGHVGGHVVHRRRRLRVPVAPADAAIAGDHGSLVGDGENDVGIVGTAPRPLIVVTARGAAHGPPRHAAILGAPENRRTAVDDVGI